MTKGGVGFALIVSPHRSNTSRGVDNMVGGVVHALKEIRKLAVTDAWMSGHCLFLWSPASSCFETIALYRSKNPH